MSGKLDLKEKLGLTQLGTVFAAFFLILHMVLGREDKLFIFIALGFLLAAIFFYRLLRPLNRLWLGFGEFMGKVVGSFILGLVFFLLLTPIALLRRLVGGKGMCISFDDPCTSFWITRERKTPEDKDFERQF